MAHHHLLVGKSLNETLNGQFAIAMLNLRRVNQN